MNRRKLLKNLGLIGLSSIVPYPKSFGIKTSSKQRLMKTAGCWLTPQKTEGPFYFNSNLVRQDIRTDFDTGELHDGLQLNMTFTVIDANCNPVPNVLVDIWHCDKDGLYSGYTGQLGGVSTIDMDFLRGIQVTDANGQCSFITSYPGWYPGRATHIHFKARLDSTTYVTSQFAFQNSINDTVYATSLYLERGPNPTSNEDDNIFGTANPEFLIMDASLNSTTGGYDGTFTIGVNAPTGVMEEDINPNGFLLEQNYPNPFNPSTKIRYTLPSGNNTKLSVYDVFGKKVTSLINTFQQAGSYEVIFDASKLSSGFYFYRLTAGNFIKTKEMLLLK
jgi:protocatechuate 3,4-dioxygenase beta subunit